ncbi:MAG: tRNA (guanosine(46)-N7)-methyltransferase TrmB [Pseudomonadota bacterium]
MIRSFVRRRGRITAGQQRALDTLWPHYGVDTDKMLDLNALFGRPAEKHLEIGFGSGDALVTMAKAHPEHDYLGIDIYRPGIGHLLLQIEAAELTNVRVICADAVEVLQDQLPLYSLDAVYLFFPDPWSKKRHQKRRLVQPDFVKLLAQRMKSGGYLQLATDWENYAEQMLEVLEAAPEFINHVAGGGFADRPPERPLTKFEQRGLRLGHRVWDLVYLRRDSLK